MENEIPSRKGYRMALLEKMSVGITTMLTAILMSASFTAWAFGHFASDEKANEIEKSVVILSEKHEVKLDKITKIDERLIRLETKVDLLLEKRR